MKKLHIFACTITVVAVLFAAGCTQESMGIFYSLEVEKDLEGDKGLDDSLKVWKLTKTADSYFIAAGKVYRRGIEAGTWEEIPPPAEGMLSSDIEFFNGTLYAMYRTGDAATSKLYTYAEGSGPWTQTGTVSGADSERITGLMAVGSGLYVSVLKEDLGTAYDPYALYYSADGSTFSLVDLPGDNDYSVRMIFDGDFDGTNYWFVSGDSVFAGTDPAVLTSRIGLTNTDGTDITPADIGGVYYCPELEKIFISSKDGVVLAKNQPAASADLSSGWYSSITKYTGETAEVFYDMIKVPGSGYDDTGAVTVIVGSDNGYYEIGIADSPDADSLSITVPSGLTETTTINYLNTKLSNNSIRSFAYDPAGAGGEDDIIFACTTSSGLWRNTYSADAGQRIWSRE
jgi:hypothetical protein